jgi:anthranilate phosphoribosyltransferase
MAPLMAGVLAARGSSALVFRGEDGLDELTTSGPSRLWLVGRGQVRECLLDPADLGIDPAPVSALRGDDATYNAQVARDVLAGAQGPVRDAVLLNAAAALVAADGVGDGEPVSAETLVPRLGDALARAAAAVDAVVRPAVEPSAVVGPAVVARSSSAQPSSNPSAKAASRSCWE